MTMTVDTVILYEWSTAGDLIDIPWPEVHQAVGADCIAWISEHSSIELTVIKEDHSYQLIAEFYDDAVARDYWLLWSQPLDRTV